MTISRYSEQENQPEVGTQPAYPLVEAVSFSNHNWTQVGTPANRSIGAAGRLLGGENSASIYAYDPNFKPMLNKIPKFMCFYGEKVGAGNVSGVAVAMVSTSAIGAIMSIANGNATAETIQFVFRLTDIGNSVTVNADPLAFPNNTPICIVAVVPSTNINSCYMYINGVRYGTLATGTFSGAGSTLSKISLGITTGSSLINQSNWKAYAVGWGDAITEFRAQEISQRPWSMFQDTLSYVHKPASISVGAYYAATESSMGSWTAHPGGTLASCINETIASDAEWIEGVIGTNTPDFPWDPIPVGPGTYDFPVRAEIDTGTTGQIRSVFLDGPGGATLTTGDWHPLTNGYAEYTDNITLASTSTHFRLETQV